MDLSSEEIGWWVGLYVCGVLFWSSSKLFGLVFALGLAIVGVAVVGDIVLAPKESLWNGPGAMRVATVGDAPVCTGLSARSGLVGWRLGGVVGLFCCC